MAGCVVLAYDGREEEGCLMGPADLIVIAVLVGVVGVLAGIAIAMVVRWSLQRRRA
ncbi:hypothetical protein GCM10023317_59810 [Actinopolymorpha pittospori]